MSIILQEKATFKTAKLRKEHVKFIDYVRNLEDLDSAAEGLTFLLNNPLKIAQYLNQYKHAKAKKQET